MKRPKEPEYAEVEIERLGPKGVGLGRLGERWVWVRPAAPGSRVLVQLLGRTKQGRQGERLEVLRPAPDAVEPACPVFGLCGGCTLQELPLEAQRAHKWALALHELGEWAAEVPARRVVGGDEAYGYRNKVELSFGTERYLPRAEHRQGLPIRGRFLGFHAPGRFDRVVDAAACALIPAAANRLLQVVRRVALDPAAPEPYDARLQTGFWRHLTFRIATAPRQILVGIDTAFDPGDGEGWVERLAQELDREPLDEGYAFAGLLWRENQGKADVSGGEIRRSWGQPRVVESLGGCRFPITLDSFFQVNTAAAEVLVRVVQEAAGTGERLLDLYCGAGALTLTVGQGFRRREGWEEVPAAVEAAREAAAANGVDATFRCCKVEDALAALQAGPGTVLVVDPPRSGLHPAVARALAAVQADRLVYVACNPASLGRDGQVLLAGGWTPTSLWAIDLFPQTGHLEVVACFQRLNHAC